MSADIFISFASQDQKVAMTLCSALESRGFRCWISARDILPGENFQSAIVRAIRHAKIMLLVFTANSNNSDEMNKELALASQSKLIVVPLRIEDVTPNDAFAYEFATRQWIDFFADWELAIQQLALRIGAAIGQVDATAAEEPSATATPVPSEAEPAKSIPESRVIAEPPAEPAPARRSRAPLYLSLSAAALVALVAGLVLPGALRQKAPASAAAAVPAAVAKPGVQRVAIQVSAPESAPPQAAAAPAPSAASPGATLASAVSDDSAADKPAPRRKSARLTRRAENYVPY